MTTSNPARAVLAAFLLAAVPALSSDAVLGAQSATDLPADFFKPLTARHVGPVGNRVSAVTGVAGDPNIYYIGAASGGVFKTVDGGVHWSAIFDDQPVQSIGALAVAPSDPNVVWAGTGETFIRSNVSHGNGIYRSTDGGRRWSHRGLDLTGRIGRVVVHPTNPDVVYAAALGHLYGPQEERGVYRTRDGGENWERVLFVNDSTGAVDLVMDPNNPRVLFAATWQMYIRTWGRWSGGAGSGIWMSRDGGDSWERLQGRGLPSGPLGKIGLAMSAANSDRVYALIETNANREMGPVDPDAGVLWRSDDSGESWTMVNADHTLTQRPLYYTRAAVAPDDADEIHFLATRHTVSHDGGATFDGGSAGGDNHDMWIDPLLPDRMIVGHDQGVSISTTRGEAWMRPRLPIAQMYHAFTDRQVPYRIYGNRQDGSSVSVPSRYLGGGDIPVGEFETVGGCESGFAVPDTVEVGVVWSGCYEGILDRHDARTGLSRTVSAWPDNPEGWPAGELRYRFQWTFPIHISPHDNQRVYVGSQHVHRTTNGGQSWEVISPDLTTNDPTLLEKTGGLTPDDASPTYGAVLFAIAESPLRDGLIWAGANDGLVHVTRDGGGSWAQVSAGLRGAPEFATVSNIEPSRHAEGTAYVALDTHQLGDFDPYLYRTTDFGATWTRIDAGIERSVLSFTHVIREDPVRPGLLYAGTGNGLWVSLDDGESWSRLRSGLPAAPVHWIDVPTHFNDLVVGTYGRGFWVFDDISPLQTLDSDVLASPVTLFAPRPAYRFLSRAGPQSSPDDPANGDNPRYGATLHFWLAAAPEGPVTIDIVDDGGMVRRSLTVPGASAGLNRVVWSLEEEASHTPKLRTEPLEHEHAPFNDDGWRALGEGGRITPLAPPGRYSVRLRVGEETFTSELEVRPDPSTTSPAELEEQVAMVRELRDQVNDAVDLIDEIEWIRKAIDDVEARLNSGVDELSSATADSLLSAAREADADLIDLEMELFDLRLTGGSARQDTLRWPRRLYAKMVSLAGYVRGTDDRPTDQAREVHELYRTQLRALMGRMEELRSGKVERFRRILSASGMAIISEVTLEGSTLSK